MENVTQFLAPDQLDHQDTKRFFSFRGFMKSGTNWIGNLLNLHPEISCVGELHLQTIYETVQKNLRELPIMVDRHTRHVIRGNLQTMLRMTLSDLADPAATLIGDRTPHTLKPLVLKDVPQITVTRDGRDVLISRVFHLFNYPEVSRVFERFPEMKKTLAAFKSDEWFFRDHPDELLSNEKVVRETMRWWCGHLESDRATIATHPNLRVLSIKYEDFHVDIEASRQKMYSFLEVAPDAAADIPSQLMPLSEERPSEFNRKGQIGDWQNYITDASRQWIKEEAGEELMRQGCTESMDW